MKIILKWGCLVSNFWRLFCHFTVYPPFIPEQRLYWLRKNWEVTNHWVYETLHNTLKICFENFQLFVVSYKQFITVFRKKLGCNENFGSFGFWFGIVVGGCSVKNNLVQLKIHLKALVFEEILITGCKMLNRFKFEVLKNLFECELSENWTWTYLFHLIILKGKSYFLFFFETPCIWAKCFCRIYYHNFSQKFHRTESWTFFLAFFGKSTLFVAFQNFYNNKKCFSTFWAINFKNENPYRIFLRHPVCKLNFFALHISIIFIKNSKKPKVEHFSNISWKINAPGGFSKFP